MPTARSSLPEEACRTYYNTFGVTLASEIEIEGFEPAAPVAHPDVTIRYGPVGEGVPHDGDRAVRALADGVLNATVREGREIVVDPAAEADASFVAVVVSGELLSVVLRQRGLMVLHGSAVAKDGRAVGFIGDSGWGKSTLAAALIERGWTLLTDDLLVVESETRRPAVLAGPGSLRLTPEAAHHLVGDVGAAPRVHNLTHKLRIQRGTAPAPPHVTLDRIYLLDPSPSDAHRAEPLAPMHSVINLVTHSRGQRLLTGADARRWHLAQCSALAQSVGVYRLVRRHGLDHIDALCDLVEGAVLEPRT